MRATVAAAHPGPQCRVCVPLPVAVVLLVCRAGKADYSGLGMAPSNPVG